MGYSHIKKAQAALSAGKGLMFGRMSGDSATNGSAYALFGASVSLSLFYLTSLIVSKPAKKD
eukprot:CAMPEP_0113885816 /NCGR_PEP_ID=MMETSP0780_2-20120614/11151_1 /TAXON_ID=652834 /ORGANISM="Palpitomonas bilix" /LENGTH=61 /DNA_ID=CAMNT_0000873845 /DNA_START=111 /DNA_END=296 /DNA_ORIENTATION=+ /assembly_acc=CAM_ASM_000599